MNALDRLISYFSPHAALRRRAARSVLAQYEAGEPSRMRKFYRERGSQNEMVQRGAVAIRAQARHLARNHDLARGALRTLVNNVVGAKGIGIEPQPRRNDGSIHAEYAAALMDAYREWCRYPEVTHRLPWSRLQRAMARAWLRDGEVFGQMISGVRPDLDHGTRVPFSLEAFEADLVPMDLSDTRRNIVQGVERNQWGKPLAIHVLKTDAASIGLPTTADTKRIPWERALHLATLDHIGQIRGVSEFASVITRLEDIKDYEESERVAAKIAAMLTAYVKRGLPEMYDPESGAKPGERQISFTPGMIIDDLAIGEEIGLIDSKRPNPNLVTFRQGQLRAIAAGLGGSYSSISRDYNGTYSSQRQELVEQWIHYAVLCDEFTGEIVQPVWEQFVLAAHLSGVVRMPADLKPGSADDALFVAQAMPWIDPLKEALASKELVRSGFASETEVIRARGKNPSDVMEQIKTWRDKAEADGLVFESDAKRTSKSGVSQANFDNSDVAGGEQ
ncbi:phage portal protein [Thauera propionica]|uniref:phage portal protein n=1 Tax=Thauera propionica TaxID=2019431 RepID=UPI0023F00FD2|nr:phage portal protein [Thauera propionica]MDD3675901.1 phage portal protein [Thauera propionica]